MPASANERVETERVVRADKNRCSRSGIANGVQPRLNPMRHAVDAPTRREMVPIDLRMLACSWSCSCWQLLLSSFTETAVWVALRDTGRSEGSTGR